MTDGPVARLGHVLGWTGNAIAALIIMAGAILVGLQAKEIWTLQRAPVVYQVELPSGRVYDALAADPRATEQEAFDVASAHDAGRPVDRGWIVHAPGELEGNALAKWNALINRYSPVAREVAIVEAWRDLGVYGGGALALAIFAFLVGRALRYIFTGAAA